MAALTITSKGITLKSFQELREELKQDWLHIFGDAIDLSPTSPDGLHIDLECKTIVSIAQLLQAVVSNLDRNTAEGVWLDILASFLGLTRLQALTSTAQVIFSGPSGTSIPAGTEVTYTDCPYNWTTTVENTIADTGSVTIPCVCGGSGAVEVFVGSWVLVSTTGLNGVTCRVEDPSGIGHDTETDAELRNRMGDVQGYGLATYNTMLTSMRGVSGVRNVSLIVNDIECFYISSELNVLS